MNTTTTTTRKESPFEEYELLENIGDGSFGSVYKARHKMTNKIVAIKIIKKKMNNDNNNNINNLKEYKTWKKMKYHPNLVQLYQTFLSPSTKEFYFIMEYMDGGNLYQYINQQRRDHQYITQKEIKSILYQILSALQHLHLIENIFHRDLKPENLLISTTRGQQQRLLVKLADFGCAANIKRRMKSTSHNNSDYVCTRWYRAPEVLLKSSNYSFPIDLWAVGTIFAELINLKPLFPGQSEIDQLFRICNLLGTPTDNDWKEGIKLARKMGFKFPETSIPIVIVESLSSILTPTNQISNDGIDLLSKLLQFDPNKRITSSQALLHPFFKSCQHNDILPPPVYPIETTTTTTTTTTLFDLPSIPSSPFQLEDEEYYNNQWDLLIKSSAPLIVNNNNQEQNPSNIPRTASFPDDIIYSNHVVHQNELEQQHEHHHHHQHQHHHHHHHSHLLMKRSVSDLSIPTNTNNANTPLLSSPPVAVVPQKKKTVNRLGFWAKRHVAV